MLGPTASPITTKSAKGLMAERVGTLSIAPPSRYPIVDPPELVEVLATLDDMSGIIARGPSSVLTPQEVDPASLGL